MPSLALVWDLIVRGNAPAEFNATAAAADRAAVATGRAAAGTEKAAVAAGRGSRSFAGTAKALGALAAVDLGYHMMKSAETFQTAMLKIHTQAGASTGQVKQMSAAVLNLAGPTATAPEKLATSLYHAFSVTHKMSSALDIMKLAAEGAKIGGADLEETTNALTSTYASGIKGVSSMSQAMGMLNATVGAGDMKMQDLNEALGSGVLTVVKQYGVTMRDAGAALATFGDNNIRGAHAGTMLRMAVQALAVPAKAGVGILSSLGISSDVSGKALSRLHITTGELSKDMQTGGLNKALVDLKGHLDKAGISGDQMGTILTQAFGKRAGPGLQVLIGQLPRFESKLKAVTDGGNKFGSDWQAWLHSSAGQFQTLEATVQALGVKFGTALLPVAQAVAGVLKSLFTFIAAHSTIFKVLALGILGVATAMKAVSVAIAIQGKITAFIGLMQTMALRVRAAFGSNAAAATLSSREVAASMATQTAAVRASTAEQEAMLTALARQRVALGRIPIGGAAMPVGGAAAGGRFAGAGGPVAVGAVSAYMGYNAGKDASGGNKAIGALASLGGMSSWLGNKISGLIINNKGLGQSFEDLRLKAEAAAGSGKNYDSIVNGLKSAVSGLAGSQRSVTAGLAAGTGAMRTQTVTANQLNASIKRLSGDKISAAQAELQFKDGVAQASQQVKQNGRSLSENTVKGRSNREWLLTQISALNGVASAQLDAGQSTASVTKKMHSNEAALRKAAIAAGLNKDQVNALIKKYGQLPSKPKTIRIILDDAAANAELNALLAKIPSGTFHFNVEADYTAREASFPHHARGGPVSDGWFTVGEQGGNPNSWELGHKQGSKVDIFSNAQSKAMTGMSHVPGFAGGTNPSAMGGNGSLIAELRRITAAVERNAQQTADALDGVGKRATTRARTQPGGAYW